ncbi:MAG: hypothetical protein JNJ89_12155 [Rubrivivax sp.]|nr:hypothetical protein [Rubrivivax sp.]
MLRLTLLVTSLLLAASLAANLWLARRGTEADRRLQSWSAGIDQVEVLRTEGGLLQVSTIRAPETFKAVKPHDLLGIDLGATTTHIRVPATYHFHIELAREWKLRIRPDGTVVVIAPAVKPTLPVAIDTARLERQAEGRWSLFTGARELQALERTITATLAEKAASPGYVAFQREAARQTVAEFVQRWMLTQERWKPARAAAASQAAAGSAAVRVLFADEPIASLPDWAGPAATPRAVPPAPAP